MRCKVVGTYLDYEHTRDAHRYFVELLVPEGYRRSRDILSVSMFDFIRAAGLEKTGEFEMVSDDEIRTLTGREFDVRNLIPTEWIASECKAADGPDRWVVRENPGCDRCGKYCDCGEDWQPAVCNIAHPADRSRGCHLHEGHEGSCQWADEPASATV